MQIVRERARKQSTKPRSNVRRGLRLQIQLAQFFEQLVHHSEQQLALGTEVLVEAANRELGAPCDLFNGSVFVTFFTEQREACCFQACSFVQAAFCSGAAGRFSPASKFGRALTIFAMSG